MYKADAHTLDGRMVISSLDKEFARLHSRCCSLIRATPKENLYANPRQSHGRPPPSMGENVLRGAAAVEQTFGGITANLWDDPFEWTLPENLSTPARIIEYLEEVEAMRRLAFASFAQDADLLKEVMLPAAETQALIALLIETLVQAAEYYGRAIATLSLLADLESPDLAV